MPADLGLPALGVLMQLQAYVFMVYALVGVVSTLPAIAYLGGTGLLFGFACVVAGVVRGFLHARAGRAAVTRSPTLPDAVKRYGVASIVTAVVFVLTLVVVNPSGDLPLLPLIAIIVLTLYWPVTVWLLVRRNNVQQAFRAAESFELALVPRDRGIEGIGVIMTVFGGISFILLLFIGVIAIDELPRETEVAYLLLALLGTLILRAGYHMFAGLKAVRGTTPTAFDSSMTIYLGLAVLSVVAYVVILFTTPATQNGLAFIIAIVLGVGLLMVWPTILRRYAAESRRTLSEDDATPIGVAPDRGLTALGYLLITLGTITLAFWVLGLLAISPLGPLGGKAMGAVPGTDANMWMTPISTGLLLWAGISLVQMNAHYQIATVAYAVVSAGFSIYSMTLYSDLFRMMGSGQGWMGLVPWMSTIVTLALPLFAAFLVFRKLPAGEHPSAAG